MAGWRNILARLGLTGILVGGMSAAAEKTYAEPIAVWDAFLTALRSGHMRDAYACIAPRMRSRLNYRDFCVAWHPLTKNYQTVLQPPVFSEFCISGEIACLRLGVRESRGAGADFTRAYLVREAGGWWMVAADPRAAAPVVAEADGRQFLRELWRQSALARESLRSGASADMEALRRELPALFALESTRRVLENYELEVENLRSAVLRLRPRNDEVRCLELDQNQRLTVRDLAPARPVTTDEIARLAAKAEAEKRRQEVAALQAEAAAKAVAEKAALAEQAALRRAAAEARLPERPPEFGNPDDLGKITPIVAKSPARAVAAKGKTRPAAVEEFPEFDDGPEMLMSAPAGGAVPVTSVELMGK